MPAEYIHTNVEIRQSPKRPGEACGDVVEVYRDAVSTNIILCDGIGSGLKANIFATMACTRIVSMLKARASIKKCFESVGETMNKAWGTDQPFAVFTIARISDTGKTTVLSYDMPIPVFVTKQYAELISSRVYYWEKAQISESHFQIDQHEGLVLMSDGITQAGLGNGIALGWESEGVSKFINHHPLNREQKFNELAEAIHQQALMLWGKKYGDDCSVVFAHNRRGITLNVLTGTPKNKEDDHDFVMDYMASEGIKAVCGGSTSKMVARETKQSIEILEEGSTITPPAFSITGITCATEGMITLNQLYNILSEEIEDSGRGNVVLELADYFRNADKIIFWVGKSGNIGHEMLELKQQGILNRIKIVELISEKLRQLNKLVLLESR